MFKNMLKRSWLSTIRKPSRSIILVIILFVMANLLLATIAIKNSVDASMSAAKNKLDATVNLTIDNSGQEGPVDMEALSERRISEELAQEISQSEYLKDYTYSLSITANADSFSVVTTQQNESEQQFREAFNSAQDTISDAQNQAEQNQQELNESVESFNESAAESQSAENNAQQQGPGGMPGDGGQQGSGGTPPQFGGFQMNFNIGNVSDPTLLTGDTQIIGINAYNFIDEYDNGSMTLQEEVGFDENSKNSAIISQKLAEENGINVGDTIKLKTISDESEIALTVVDIYTITGNDDFNFNTIYTNVDTAKKFYSSEQLKNLSVTNVKYFLTSASDKDAFLVDISENVPEVAENNLKLDVDTSSYDAMVEPIEKVGAFATTIMWIVLIASAVIITLIVVINVKDRRNEMGILLSLGGKRAGILGQIFLELVIVGTIAFAGSIATSQVVASNLGDLLVNSETSQEQTDEPMGGGRGRMAFGGNTTQITNVDVSAGLYDYLTLFGLGYLILVIAMIVPSINILRYQPKTILSGKE